MSSQMKHSQPGPARRDDRGAFVSETMCIYICVCVCVCDERLGGVENNSNNNKWGRTPTTIRNDDGDRNSQLDTLVAARMRRLSRTCGR